MKAAYEMPYVRIEEFTPNVAVANCGDGEYYFDCLKGKNADNANLISLTMGVDCDNDCGFADFSGSISGAEGNSGVVTTDSYSLVYDGYKQEHSGYNDTLTWGGQTKTGVDSQGNATWSGTWNGTVTADSSRNFLGWLYIGKGSGHDNDTYSSVTASVVDGILHLLTSAANHVLLAPVYGLRATDVQMS